MKTNLRKNVQRRRRSLSVRSRLRKRSDRPRLSVNRTLKHISAQIIDDAQGRTLCSASTNVGAMGGELAGKTKSQRAAVIGAEIARKAKEAGVDSSSSTVAASSFMDGSKPWLTLLARVACSSSR
jgi:large subunit ribosomal protein L18